MLYHLGNTFVRFNLEVILDDTKTGIRHLSVWDKITMVSDHEMINAMVRFFGYLIPLEVRIFKNAVIDEARKWITEKKLLYENK